MHNPPHPGEVLKELWLDEISITVTELANKLDVSRQSMSNFLNQKTGVSPEFAIKLAKAFRTTPDQWLDMQTQYDLWQIESNKVTSKKLLKNVQFIVPSLENLELA
jgi:addiction module HigA family antidote